MTWYLTIRGAADYSRFATTAALVEFLAALPELRQTGPVSFESAEAQPWVHIILASCHPDGGYASTGSFVQQINVVELVCSDSSHASWYDALAGRIARFLDWSAFDDHEGRQVWPVPMAA